MTSRDVNAGSMAKDGSALVINEAKNLKKVEGNSNKFDRLKTTEYLIHVWRVGVWSSAGPEIPEQKGPKAPHEKGSRSAV